MIEYPVSRSLLLPVVLLTTAGAPATGVLAASTTASIVKSNGTAFDVTITSNWVELSGAYSGTGYYNWNLQAGYADVQGIFQYCVQASGTAPYFGVVKIVSGDSTMIYDKVVYVSSSISGSTTSLAPVLKILGTPIKTVSTDIREIARLIQGLSVSLPK